jgi:site-specific DNA-cytosine methylase
MRQNKRAVSIYRIFRSERPRSRIAERPPLSWVTSKLERPDMRATMAWASFPCQDLSLAGNGAGLRGGRSGTFWPFWQLITSLKSQSRAPGVVALENVYGTLTSHGGRDFAAIATA